MVLKVLLIFFMSSNLVVEISLFWNKLMASARFVPQFTYQMEKKVLLTYWSYIWAQNFKFYIYQTLIYKAKKNLH
jgi:hypothetical protein